MKKTLILLSFLVTCLFAFSAKAQSIAYPVYNGYGFNPYYSYYPYYYGSRSDKIAAGVYEFFWTLQDSLAFVNSARAAEAAIAQGYSNLENSKSVKRYYTEGIPPFSPITPDGRPRPPQITWQDVESIR